MPFCISQLYTHTIKIKINKKKISDHSDTSFWALLFQLDSQAHIVNFKALIIIRLATYCVWTNS